MWGLILGTTTRRSWLKCNKLAQILPPQLPSCTRRHFLEKMLLLIPGVPRERRFVSPCFCTFLPPAAVEWCRDSTCLFYSKEMTVAKRQVGLLSSTSMKGGKCPSVFPGWNEVVKCRVGTVASVILVPRLRQLCRSVNALGVLLQRQGLPRHLMGLPSALWGFWAFRNRDACKEVTKQATTLALRVRIVVIVRNGLACGAVFLLPEAQEQHTSGCSCRGSCVSFVDMLHRVAFDSLESLPSPLHDSRC